MGNNDVFAVIADKTRRGILTALKDGERPVGDLVAELGVSQPTVSKHLRILRDAGMVSMEAQGQRRLYAVRPEPLAEVTEWVHGVVGTTHRPVAPEEARTPAGPEAGERGPEAGERRPEVPGGRPEVAAPGTPGIVPGGTAPDTGRRTGAPGPGFREIVPAEFAPGTGRGTEITEPAAPGTVPEELVPGAGQETEVTEPAPTAPGTVPEEPAPARRQGAAEDVVPGRPAPTGTGLPGEEVPQRPGRGAGARAAGLLSNLPGFRRRPRHRRR